MDTLTDTAIAKHLIDTRDSLLVLLNSEFDMKQSMLTLQEKMLEQQEKITDLTQTNNELTTKLQSIDNFNLRAADFDAVALSDHSVVMIDTTLSKIEKPPIYYCTYCFHQRKLSPLHPSETQAVFQIFTCPSCGSKASAKHNFSSKTRFATSSQTDLSGFHN